MIRKKIITQELIGRGLVFLSVISFFCSDLSLNVGFTLRPFHIVALLSLLYLFFTRKNNSRKVGFSKVDKVFIIFFLVSLISALFSSFSAVASLKHMLGVFLLAGSFYIFKNLYCRFDKKDIVKTVSIAGIVVIAVTILWYIIGLFVLGFNFNIADTFCYGVRVDRKIPRLISFAYDEPNYVSIYFAILFAFFAGRKRSVISTIGLFLSFMIIILTMSRGGYIALAASLVVFLLFSGEKMKDRFIKLLYMIVSGIVSFGIITAVININSNGDNGKKNEAKETIVDTKKRETSDNNTIKSASDVMVERFQKSIKDNGSNRLVHWQDAINTFKENVAFGIGPGNILDYNREIYRRESPSHNSYLDTLAEQGVLGSVAYIFLIIVIVVTCWKNRKYTIMPSMSFVFLFASEMFLSLTVSDMLFINILMLDVVSVFCIRDKNYLITKGDNKRAKLLLNRGTDKKIIISMIVPVYNVEKYIKRCLVSLTEQTAYGYEVIIVDDGSTDKSSEICKRFSSEYSFVKYYRTKNSGLSAARNYGVKKAKGEYLWFVDGDDFIAYDSVERVQRYLTHDIVTIGYYNYYDDYTITDGNDYCTDDAISRFFLNPAFAPLKIVKRKLFENKNVQFPEGRNFEDIGIMYSLAKYTSDICHSGEKVYFYRRRQGSITKSFSERNYMDHLWAADQINKIHNKGHEQELEYQLILQILFMAFDVPREKKRRKEILGELHTYLKKKVPNYGENIYLKRRDLKNVFYRMYIGNVSNGRFRMCIAMNWLRNTVIKGRS